MTPDGFLAARPAHGAMADLVTANGHTIEAAEFRRQLIAWGRNNFRPFPWRFTEDPYRILLAEVMLHRTQARQVQPVYERAVKQYPDVASLAVAPLDELHQDLYSLGLRWRIELIRQMAEELHETWCGEVPRNRDALLLLPGVSAYIASAVRCFAWNIPEAIVDTNTVRVVGRLFGLEIKDSSRRNRLFIELIQALVDPENPRAYNYALLDLADRVCTARQAPQCEQCPVAGFCLSAATNGLPAGASPAE